MAETIDSTIENGKQLFEKALDHLKDELQKLRAGKAAPTMLNGIMVEYYGNPTIITQVANITAIDSRTLAITPWEKKMLGPIERAIFEANMGITPMNDGESVKITIPPVTEDRRRDLVKQGKSLSEDAKVSIRSVRHKMIDFIKKEVKDGYPEDAGKRKETEVENLVKEYVAKVDTLMAAKEKDIMKV